MISVILLLCPSLMVADTLLEPSPAAQQLPPAAHHSPAAQQLSELLDAALERASQRAKFEQLLCQARSLQSKAPEPEPKSGSDQGPEPEPEPVCERHPKPLSPEEEEAPYQEPTQRACARSCLQLRDQGGSPPDGVYWLSGMPVPVLCDFSHDGGGWTLLLTAVSQPGWDWLSVMGRAERSPSLSDNYSILRYADGIRDLGSGGRFAYRLEAQAEKGRRRWGGIWWAPRHYSFVDETGDQTDVRLVRKFDRWEYKDVGIEKRMPWLRIEGGETTVLTTTAKFGEHWWGTLVSHENYRGSHRHSPWIGSDVYHSGTVLYWMREEML